MHHWKNREPLPDVGPRRVCRVCGCDDGPRSPIRCKGETCDEHDDDDGQAVAGAADAAAPATTYARVPSRMK